MYVQFHVGISRYVCGRYVAGERERDSQSRSGILDSKTTGSDVKIEGKEGKDQAIWPCSVTLC